MSEEATFAIGVPGLEPERRRWDWGLLLLHLLAALAGFLGPSFVYTNTRSARCGGGLTACKSNCKNIATALEMYSSDNGGQYPASLDELIPGNYLAKIPTCPAAGSVTYKDYQRTQTPDSFSFTCVGNNHAKAYNGFSTSSNNFPQYSAESGLLDHP